MPPPPELTGHLQQLVATLSAARARAAETGDGDAAALSDLVARARACLDLADEKLLALDRYSQRSTFRQAQRIRVQLERLDDLVAGLPLSTARRETSPPVVAAA